MVDFDETANIDDLVKATDGLLKLAIEGVDSGVRWLRDLSKTRAALEAYVKIYERRYGQIKLFLFSKPMPLKQIFTPIRVVDPKFLQTFGEEKILEQAFLSSGRLFSEYSTSESENGFSVAETTQFLNILGAPGSGKSTFLRRLGLKEIIKSDWSSPEKLDSEHSVPMGLV